MRRESPLSFRIPADLKERLEDVAEQEARSVSQVCEMMLRIGVAEYDKEGTAYLARLLGRRVKEGREAEEGADK